MNTTASQPRTIRSVVFDMDGVLFDTEEVWHQVRRQFALETGGHWTEGDHAAMMGANTRQWSRYMREQCGIPLPVEEIEARVIGELRHRYRHELSVYPGAEDVVERLAARYLLGVASSSPRELIETALEVAGLRGFFAAVVSSDDVSHGKPEPDVYLMACELLAVPPSKSAAIEDSGNGIMSAFAAGLAVVAIPNKEFPPPPQVVSLAEKVLASISELNVDVIASLTGEVSND